MFCVVSCWLHASGAFFACCSTCNVLILSQIISACSMSSEIHHLQLRFALFLLLFFNGGWTFGKCNLTLNLSRLVNFRNKAVSIYVALMIFNFIPANSAKWGEMLDVNIHKTVNKVVLTLKRKKAKARTNAKKK